MNDELSRKITNTSFILTLLIVLLHSECLSYLNNTSNYYIIIKVVCNFILSICAIAVPTFFSISGYLFFINYDNSKYFYKLKTRIKSLCIPYLCWSTIMLLLFVIISNMPQFQMFDGIFTPIEYNSIFMIKSIFLATYDGVLWYIRDLLFFALIVFLLVLLNLLFKIDYYNPLFWLPIYLISSYFAINYSDKAINFKFNTFILKFLQMLIVVVYLFLLILHTNYKDNYYIFYFYRFFSPIFVYFVIIGIDLFKHKIKLSKYAFLIYCSHRWGTIIIKKSLILVFGLNGISCIIFQFLTAISTILIVLLIVKVLEKVFPKFLLVLSGNRISN